MGAPGHKPIFDENGNVVGPFTADIMADPRYQPDLLEQLTLGVGKAHRQVVYSHYEYRNYKRSYLNTRGVVGK